MNVTQKQIQKKIDANVRLRNMLHNETIDLIMQRNRAGEWQEDIETRKINGKKTKVRVGRKFWKERFTDEGTGKSFYIKRSCICSIDGKLTDQFGRIIEKKKI